jgi:site-specific recombinase XerD
MSSLNSILLDYEKKNHEQTETANHEQTLIETGNYLVDKELHRLLTQFLFDKLQHVGFYSIRNHLATFRHYSFLVLSDFDKPNAYKWFEQKSSAKWSKITMQGHLVNLSTFGNWLCLNHLTNQRFHPKVTRRPKRREIPKSFELELLFDSLRNDWQNSSDLKKFVTHQRYIFVRCLYELGARVSEVAGIYLNEITQGEKSWFVFIDGTKSESSKRTIELSNNLFSEINHFRNVYELEGRLFSSSRGNALDTCEFGRWLRVYSEKLGISCKIHPHLFRYLFIIESIKEGKDAIEVMTRLGHSDVSMTIYYFNQVRRLYPEAELSASISILEKKKGYNSKIYGKGKIYG